MRKLFWVFWLILGLFFLIQLGCQKKAEEKKSYEILTKTTPKMTLIYLEHVGPYDQVGGLFGQLGEYAAKKNLSGQMVGIYYDDPATVAAENLKSEIGIVVPEGTMPDSGYGVQEIPAGEVAYAVLQGPYEKIAGEYPAIYKWIEEQGYKKRGPLMEIYLKAGPGVPSEELVTEVQIPITK
jgi:AraC family transcriptional regulator